MPTLTLAAPREFDIPAGQASQSLTRFAQQADTPLIFPYELTADRRTRRVRGRMEPDEALRQLLRGTGLAARRDATGQIVIERLRTRERARTRQPDSAAPAADMVSREFSPDLEEVRITGSRIVRDGMTSPTPVTSISREELQILSTGTLAEALVELPHFLNNDTPQSQSFGTSAAAGSSHMNLRGIGSIRTLTLLDGRRIVPATRFGTIDYALLPKALIQNVEVVTGGASAAYGSDAVSGVVNLFTQSRFEGLRVQAQAGITERGDNSKEEISLTWGSAIGDRSHLVVSGEFYRANGIRGYRSRDWFESWATIANPDPAGPTEITVRNARATGYTYGGLITSGPLAGTQFLPGGIPAPFVRGEHYTSLTQSGGDGVDPAADLVWMLPDQTRANAFLKFSSEITPQFSFFTQLLAGHSDNAFEMGPPSLWGSWEATIFPDNAFLPQSIREQMQTRGLASFRLGRMGNGGELGRNFVHNRGDLFSATLGTSHLLGGWQVDSHYQYGQNRNRLHYSDNLRIDHVYRGIDSVVNPATGEIVCRSTLTFPDDGCVPVNIFGEGSVSPAARAYITAGSYEQSQDVSEHVAEIQAQGTLLALPAGRIKAAAGINWRQESVRNTPRRTPASDGSLVVPLPAGYFGLPFAYFGASSVFERTVVNSVAGHYSVWEMFGEAAVPLLSDQPLVQELTLHAAVRYARYSGSGPVPAWKGGLDWALTDELRLRATRSRDVRAGSLSERFDVSRGGISIRDPALPGTPTYASTFERNGNPNVEPEQADTWTAGLVYKPDTLQGLSISADYYDIRIDDAISTLGVQSIIDRCQAGEQNLCALISRTSDSNIIQLVNNLVLNVAGARSRGIDLEFGWRQPVDLFGGDESLAVRLFANRVLESSVTGATGQKIDRAYQTGIVGGAPSWQANMSISYRRGPLQLALQQRLISGGKFNATLGPEDIDNNRVAGAAYTNLRGSWQSSQLPGLNIHAQVSNLFDQDPPRAPDWSFIGSTATNESLFDVLGRRYTVGFTYDLN
jgi:outer membrane receptor protein involved in Fe transport